MPSGVLRQRHHVERAHDGAAHGRRDDSVMREHIGLAFRGRRAVAAHGRENKGRMPRDFQYSATERTMVAMLAMPRLPTPMAMRDPGFRFAPKPAGSFRVARGGDIGKPAIGKVLADEEDAGELHIKNYSRRA